MFMEQSIITLINAKAQHQISILEKNTTIYIHQVNNFLTFH